MVFRPPRLAPVLLGSGAVLVALALASMRVAELLGNDISFSSFFVGLWALILLALAGLAAWRTCCCWRMRYHLTRDSLTINWGHRRVVIPMGQSPRLVESREKEIKWGRGGLHWFALHVSSGFVESLCPVQFYATHLSPDHLVYVEAGEAAYGLSVENPRRFARYLETCKELGPLSWQAPRVEHGALVSLPFWRDRWAVAMVMAGFLANLALFAYLSHRYPDMPSFLALHFSPSGQVDRVGVKLEIFKLPAMALVVLGSNSLLSLLLHVKERYLAHVALAVALVAQALFWIASVQIAG